MGVLPCPVRRNADGLQHTDCLLLGMGLIQMLVERDAFGNLVTHRHNGVQCRHGVLEDHGDVPAADFLQLTVRCLQNGDAVKRNLSVHQLRCMVRQNAHDCLCNGSLACAGLAHQAQGRALRDIQRYPIDCLNGLAA